MLHKDIPVGADSSHPPGYVQAGDPGAVGANKVWIDTSGGAGNWLTKIRNAANGAWETVGGGAAALDDLTDVDTTGQTAGDVLAYDGADWIPTDLGVIPADLDDLSDVDTTGVGSGDVLTYDGADWIAQAPTGGGSGERTKVDPTGLTLAWINQGGASEFSHDASLFLYAPANAADDWHFRAIATQAKPYEEIFHIKPAIIGANYSGILLGWLQTSDNHFAGYSEYFNGAVAGGLIYDSVKSGTNYTVTALYTAGPAGRWEWVRLKDAAAGNRTIEVSRTGFDDDWILFHSVATDDFVTPDRIIIGVNSRNATFPAGLTVDSWERL